MTMFQSELLGKHWLSALAKVQIIKPLAQVYPNCIWLANQNTAGIDNKGASPVGKALSQLMFSKLTLPSTSESPRLLGSKLKSTGSANMHLPTSQWQNSCAAVPGQIKIQNKESLVKQRKTNAKQMIEIVIRSPAAVVENFQSHEQFGTGLANERHVRLIVVIVSMVTKKET
jgi:hypothetical protein